MRVISLLIPTTVLLILLVLTALLGFNRGPGAVLYNTYGVPGQLRRAIAIIGIAIGLCALFGIIGAALGWFPSSG